MDTYEISYREEGLGQLFAMELGHKWDPSKQCPYSSYTIFKRLTLL